MKYIVVGIGIVGILVVIAVLVSVPVWLLWNWLMPGIFGLPHIGFWQSLGLLVLSRILFGGFRGWRGHHDPRGWWMLSRWEGMSPEERERFRNMINRRCSKGDVPEPGVPAT